MVSVYEERTRACQRKLGERGATAAVLFPGPNLYYLSGFYAEPWDRHFLLFVPSDGSPCFVVPEVYEEQVRESSWIETLRTWTDQEGPLETLRRTSETLGLDGGHLLLDDQMWTTFAQDIRAVTSDATFGVASEALDELRSRKDETELDTIRRASEIADEVSRTVRAKGDDVIGMTERELATEIENQMLESGADDAAFDVSASSGPNTARVFYHHGDREIERGDPVLLDFGAVVDHYRSDQTRMVVFAGEPPAEFERMHDAVSEALEAGVDAVRPGVPVEAVELACHDVLAEYGCVDQTLHRTGHGVGLTVHEAPNVIEGNERELEPGMVFSVEPGVYFEGEFGVRIEDLVAVTEDGAERLNSSPRTWQPLD